MQAFEAIQLCCEDSREHVLLLCKSIEKKARMSHSHDDELKRTINEMCSDSISLLRILGQCGYQNVQDRLQLEIVKVIEIWSNAGSLFLMLPVPMLLIEKWVQVTREASNYLYYILFVSAA